MADDAAIKVTRAGRREQSREVILRAATDIFAERGYAGTSLDDISAVSGVKRSLILYYFKNKDELWRAAADQVARNFNSTVRAKLACLKAKDENSRLRSSLGAWLDAFLEEPDLARFLVREGGMAGPRLEWLIEQFEYSTVPFGSPNVKSMLRSTIMRDALVAIYLSMAALGPLMEAFLSHVSGRPQPGVHPMSLKTRKELVDLLARFIGAVDEQAPGDHHP